MRTWNHFSLAMILAVSCAVAAIAPTWAADRNRSQAGNSGGSSVTTVEQAIDRIIARDHDENAVTRRYSPIVETYVQDMKSDPQLGVVPVRDHYYLGQADLSNGVVDNSILEKKKKGKGEEGGSFMHMGGSSANSGSAFLRLIYVDSNGLDRLNYQFDYVGREFLGEVRCLVFDVTPLPKSGKERFYGRIWAEDQGFAIVRYNGVYSSGTEPTGFSLHFDSWRLNMQPDLWLPAFVYSQESEVKSSTEANIRFKAQTRLWGYALKAGSGASFNQPGASIEGHDLAAQDSSPIDAERQWQQQAEQNVVNRLERIGLIAPRGEVDKVLETVINNLEVTNDLDIEPDIKCRVLLTGTLESFTVGHTIVMSRGLIDVLPDEASLAAMLAQDLAAIVVTKSSADQYGFNDTTNVTAGDALSRFSFKATPTEVEMANQKAIELLKHSPYKDKLTTAALFLKQVQASSEALPSFIDARLGNSLSLSSALVNMGPALQADKLDQVAALPMGSRVKVDPWSDRVELVKSKPVSLHSAREKMPFEVTPFLPFVTRYSEPKMPAASTSANKDGAHR
jgi:hypothetical protein